MSGLSINSQPNIRGASWSQIVEERSSAESREFKSYMESMRELKNSKNADTRNKWKAHSQFMAALAPNEVHTDKALTNMSVKYANDEFIGLRLMPLLPVSEQSGLFWEYSKRDTLSAPSDAMGDRGVPNEITQSRSQGSYKCTGRGLKGAIPETTVINQDTVLDELADVNEAVNESLALKREQRLATILQTGANYGGNTSAVTSWGAGAGDPVADVQFAQRALWQGMGTGKLKGFTSLDVFHALSRHPKMTEQLKYTGNGMENGLVTPRMMAAMFGLDELLVGRARQETSNDGQTASYSRIWGNSFGIVRVADRPTRQNAAFGYTFRWNLGATTPRTIVWTKPTEGTAGVHYVQTTFSETEKVVAPTTSYLLTGVLA